MTTFQLVLLIEVGIIAFVLDSAWKEGAPAAPLLIWPGTFQSESLWYWGWLARAPFLLFGVMLMAKRNGL